MNTATLPLDGSVRVRAGNAPPVVPAPPLSAAALSLSLLDELPYGVLVVDRTLRVVLANALARTMVERGDCMSLTCERLRFLDPATSHRFASAVAQVMVASAGAPTRAAAFRVSRQQGGADYLASLKQFTVFGECESLGSAYSVQLFDTHARRCIAPRFLRQLHGLTATEAIVAAQLYQGLTLQEAAHVLSISVHTIKTHLKRIFEKCSVRSQADLLRLMEFSPRFD